MANQATFRNTVRPIKKTVNTDLAGVLDFSGRATSFNFTSGQSLNFSSTSNTEHLIEGQVVEIINSTPSDLILVAGLMEDGNPVDVEPDKVSVLIWTSNSKFFDMGGTAYTKNVEDAFIAHVHNGTDTDKILATDLDTTGGANGEFLTIVAGNPVWSNLDDQHIDWTVDNAGTDIHRDNLQVASTTEKGVVELAVNLESTPGVVVQGNDSRLSDARTPVSHSHTLVDVTDSGDLAALDTVGTAEIETDAVTNTRLANMGPLTMKGNDVGSVGDAKDLTVSEVQALLNVEDDSQANVQSDWNAVSGDSQVLNKPTDITDLSSHNVTELSDITSAGSGAVITVAERADIHDILTISAGITSETLTLTDQALTVKLVTTSTAGVMSSTDKTKLDGIESAANNYSHPNHTGDVTSTADGATVITNDVVTYSKIQNVVGNNIILGNNSGAGTSINELTASDVRTVINVEDGATADLSGSEIKTLYEAETNAYTDTKNSKLSGIETNADVTDSTNVDAAGATMNSDSNLSSNSYFLDEDNLISDDPTKVASQQSIKAYIDNKITSEKAYKGGYDASTNTPDLDTSPSAAISSGNIYVVTVAGNFFSVAVESGDTLISEVNSPTTEADWTIVQSNLTPASIKAQYESNPDTNPFTDSEKTQLSNTESTTELNARDSSNRNRTNHTGTQLAVTISDFDTEVSNNSSVTANTAKVSADNSVDSHSDVDVTTVTPNEGDSLEWDGTNWIPAYKTGASAFNSSVWKSETGNQTPPPSSKKIKWDNSTQISSTKLYISDIDNNGTDVSVFLSVMPIGSFLRLQDRKDGGKSQVWEITGVTDDTTYYTYDVTLIDSFGGNISDNKELLVTFIRANDIPGASDSKGMQEDFNKAAHGLSIGNFVRHAGPNPEDFTGAQSNTAANSEAIGVVSSVNGDDFSITYGGRVTGLSGLTPGANFLSDTIAGAVTATSPTISKPVIFATSATSGIVNIMRGLDSAGDDTPSTHRISHTYAVGGEIKVPAGQDDFIVPYFISLASGQTASLVKARYVINAGTSVSCKLQKNGVDVTGFTGLSVTTTATSTDPVDVVLAEDDALALVVTGVSGTPENLTFSMFIEVTE